MGLDKGDLVSVADFKVVSSYDIRQIGSSIACNIKDSGLISGDWLEDYASGVVVVDNVVGKAEIHDRMRDVWFILSGEGFFILGGALVNKESSRPGEWNAPGISGGERYCVSAGYLVDIPPGVAHQIDARGNRLVALIVKVPV